MTVGTFSIQDVALHVQPGEYFVLLGKPGSGKTLLVECIAGLKRLSRGTIQIDGRRVEKREPRNRGIGYVPQDYALFSARTVRGNIEFPLRVRRWRRLQRERRVKELARMLGIEYLLERSTAGLSGGERQRVALARALAVEPKILLLDEPVSALDDETRDGILAELKRIQRRTGTTTIHVCHDLEEMRAVADRVGIMQDGKLIQVGTPEEVSRSPATPEIARLFRLGTVLSGIAGQDEPGSRIELPDFAVQTNQSVEGEVQLLLRAKEVRLRPSSCHERNVIARVESVLWGNSSVRIDLRVRGTLFRAEVSCVEAKSLSLEEGTEVSVVFPGEAIYVFPRVGERSKH